MHACTLAQTTYVVPSFLRRLVNKFEETAAARERIKPPTAPDLYLKLGISYPNVLKAPCLIIKTGVYLIVTFIQKIEKVGKQGRLPT